MSSPTAGDEKTVIVIAFDGSPTARRAVHYASRFLTADRAVVLTVWSPLDRGDRAGLLRPRRTARSDGHRRESTSH